MLFLFSFTLFLGAALLFISELMFAKMVLPLLGGTPAVWNTCTLFFQTALLAGYGYSHLTSTKLKPKTQTILHLVLILIPLFLLPIAIPKNWQPPTEANPIPSLLLLLTIAIGFPFLMVATTAPLIQKWFTYSGHKTAKDPYFLYAASNAGSFVGLISYIALLEPRLTRTQISNYWEYGYVFLVLLTVTCASLILKNMAKAAEEQKLESKENVENEKLGLWRQIRWLLLAAVPCSLMLGLTTYITTDITSVPLLWVIPLSIYLLTYILAFSKRRLIPHKVMLYALPILGLLLIILINSPIYLNYTLALHFITFFAAALVCHTELAIDRPNSKDLTKFYLMLAAGGALGGAFNALIAPVAFKQIAEYPIALVLAVLLCINKITSIQKPIWSKKVEIAVNVFWAVLLSAVVYTLLSNGPSWGIYANSMKYIIVFGAIFACCIFFIRNPIRFGASIIILAIAFSNNPQITKNLEFQERSFFGVSRVLFYPDGRYTTLLHGTTIHGIQFKDEPLKSIPISYFFYDSPIGQVFKILKSEPGTHNVAITGLGGGTLSAYADKNTNLTYYEIDPAIKKIAVNPDYFTYTSDALNKGYKIDFVIGDARLTLAKAPDHSFNLVIFDAFSSDSIPIHLVTKESVDMYIKKLKPGGIAAFQITNRHMDLKPIIGNLVIDAGFKAFIRYDTHLTEEQYSNGRMMTVWIVAAKDKKDLGFIPQNQEWKEIEYNNKKSLWTDDHSNILEAFKW